MVAKAPAKAFVESNGYAARPDGWDDPPRPKHQGPKGLLPSTWVSRTLNVQYDVGGELRTATGTLLDWYPAGLILNIGCLKTLIAWERVALVELAND
jgi:hypothetical protein